MSSPDPEADLARPKILADLLEAGAAKAVRAAPPPPKPKPEEREEAAQGHRHRALFHDEAPRRA